MGLKSILKKIKCKVFVCCSSKCSINDKDNDGIPDEIIIRKYDTHKLANPFNMSAV